MIVLEDQLLIAGQSGSRRLEDLVSFGIQHDGAGLLSRLTRSPQIDQQLQNEKSQNTHNQHYLQIAPAFKHIQKSDLL